MKSKKIVSILIIIVAALSFSGCTSNTTDKAYNNDSEISSLKDDFQLNSSTETSANAVYKGKYKLSGCKTIWKFESDSDYDLEVPYTLSVKHGKAKIVLISPDNKVTTLVENTDKATPANATSLTVPIKKGSNRIKIVGYDKADVEIEVHIDKGQFMK